VAEALSQLDDNQQIYNANQLVGRQRTGQFLAAVRGLPTVLTIASDSFDFLGSAAEEVQIRLQTAEVAADRAKVAFTNLFEVIGAPLLDEFTGIAGAVVDIFAAVGQAVQSDTGGLADLSDFVEQELQGLLETIEAIAVNIPAALENADLSGFRRGLEAVSDAVRGLFNLDLRTEDGLTRALEFLADAFQGLGEFTGGAIESFEPFARLLGDLATSFQELSPDEIAEIGNNLGNIGGALTQVNIAAGSINSSLPVLETFVGIIAANQGVSLLTGLRSIGPAATTAAAGISAVVSAYAGLDAAFKFNTGQDSDNIINSLPNLFGQDDFSTVIVDWIEYAKSKFGELSGAAEDSQTAVSGLAGELSEISVQAERIPVRPFNEVVESFRQAKVEADLVERGITQYIGTIVDLSQAYNEVGDSAESAAEGTSRLGADGQALTGYFSVVESGAKKASDAIAGLSEVSDDLKVELAIANIEAQTAVAVAGIEANAEKTVAAFSSIDNTISETTDSITDLFGLLGDDNISKLDKLDIRKQVEEQSELLNKTEKLQQRLIEAQIDEAQARIAALSRGDALIKVNGDGLAPHLEAIMFDLFEAIQVRVNAQGYQYLLGAPP